MACGTGTVVEFGCGDGRLAEFFDPQKYYGWDINPAAIDAARQGQPRHTFGYQPREADIALAYTVLLHVPDPQLPAVVDLMQRHRVTHAFFVPTVVQGLLRVEGVENADLSAMELLMYGAAPIGDVLLSKAMKVFDCNFMHAYGMTEAAHQMCCNPLPPRAQKPGSVGVAAGPEVRIAHEANAKGELCCLQQ